MTFFRSSVSLSLMRRAVLAVGTTVALVASALAQNYPPPPGSYGQQPLPPPPGSYGGQQLPPPPGSYRGQQLPPPPGGYGNQPPQPGGYDGGQQQRYGQPPQGQSLDELMGWERQDMGVAPSKTLHGGAMHGPTPNLIPGGQVITTKGLVPLLQGSQGVRALVFDVLGSQQQLPNAIGAAAAAQGGTFNDQTQQQFGQFLQQATGGRRDAPLVFYCQGPQCWMSYNAALRAINLGYKNVLWYRGGLEAWQRAGLPLANAQPMMPQGGYAGGQGGYPGGGGNPPR